jgi:hypothetical protein
VTWWCRLAALVLLLGIILSSPCAMAATLPLLDAYDEAVRPTAITRVETGPSVRPERHRPPEYVYANLLEADGRAANVPVAAGAGATPVYDGATRTQGNA